MSHGTRNVVRIAGVLALLAPALTCAKVSTNVGPTPGDGGGPRSGTGGGSGSGSGGAPGSTGSGGAMMRRGLPDGGMCDNFQCVRPGGQYCGVIGNGCGSTTDCGTCPGDDLCEHGVCVGGPSCVPLTCTVAGGQYCGAVGDGCGHTLQCADCASADETCSATGLCIKTAGCVPLTCNFDGGRYCGTIGDGCGNTIECGDCSDEGAICGGGGVTGVCGGGSSCVPVTCAPPSGGHYCGVIGNGCGGMLDCGDCADGSACPASGSSAHVCPGGVVTLPPTCTGATKTTISGTVFDPAGVNPLYNVIVYVPSAPLDPIPEGVSCDRCGAQVSGHPIAATLTDANGAFQLLIEPVPSTTNVPLVMQIGKWRRQVTIPSIKTCADNPITDMNLTRLPRTRAEGNIPRIAVTTGGADALECLVRRIGIADSEFGTDGSAGRVHLFAGGDGTNSFSAGGAFAAATTLWSSPAKLANYDMLVLSCEGSTSKFSSMKPQTSVDNVANWANGGGRLFLSHLHFYWLQKRPDFNMTAAYIGNLSAPPNGSILTINQTFTKGKALASWLSGPIVNASTTPGQITVNGPEHSVTSINPPTTEWMYMPSNPNDSQMRRSEQYLSFGTPVGTAEDMQCGKVVFTDIHIKATVGNTGGDDSSTSKPFPSGCKTNMMSPQAKALEFLFFDLAGCLQPDTSMPMPPVVPPPGVPTSPPGTVPRPPPVLPPPPPPPPPIDDVPDASTSSMP